jgi:KDO2-lipid IV(A) lauroyltransferase
MTPASAIDARDVRTGGGWTRRQKLKNDLLYAMVRVGLAVSALLPRAALRAGGRLLGGLAYALFAHARRTAHANVTRAFPDRSAVDRRAIVRNAYFSLGADLGDAVWMLRGAQDPLPLSPTARRLLEGALTSGRGTLFVSAHLGPWERVASGLVAAGFPLATLARESYDPRLTSLYERLRGQHGVRAIFRGSPGAASRIVRTLRDGGLLGVPMDLRSRVPSVEVPFLGHPASTAVGPARIALRTGSVVIVGTAARDEAGTLCTTATRIPTADLSPGTEGERALTARINTELGRRIRALPERWVWMHDRFEAKSERQR